MTATEKPGQRPPGRGPRRRSRAVAMTGDELNSESPALGDGADVTGPLRLAYIVPLLALSFLALVPFHLIGLLLGGRAAGLVPVLWHRFALRLLGVRVLVTGAPGKARPLLLVANHVSWLDISVLGSIAPLSFVAKSEVAGWPVFGLLAKLQRTIFVDRARRSASGDTVERVARRLARGDIVVLFAEGTSGDGNRVLPFRSSLLGAAERALAASGTAHIQPVAIAYVRMHGLPLGRQHRAHVAWYGAMDLIPHLKRLIAIGGIDVRVVFGAVTPLAEGADRKRIAGAAGAAVARVVAKLNAGHAPEEVIAEERRRRP